MGKQKGNRNRGRQQRRQQQQTQAESTKEPLNPSSVIPRLRHPDSKIRHATLITLQQLFTNGSKKNKSINLSVLQGIREQLVDNDLECSYVASQCLVLYLQQQQAPWESREDQQQQQQDTKRTEAVASWTPIVLSRLQQCYEAVVPQSQPQPQPQQSNQHFVKQWMALSSTCSQLLCLLIETNPVALERHIMTAQSANTFLNVTIGLLKHVVTPSTPPAAAALTSQQSQHSRAVQSYKDATALYVARSLHSAVDDNFELTKLILTDGIDALKDSINLLTIANKTNDPNGGQPSSSMSALHLYGCFINMYQILNYNHDAAAHTIESILLLAPVGEEDEDGVVAAHTQQKPLLLKQIQPSFSVVINATAGSTSPLSSLESAYRSAQNLRHQQQTDETLENEIIRQVADRKEPARQIARRQKETNKQQDDDDDDVDMEDATTREQQSNSHCGKITDRQQDGQQAMEDALREWNSYVEPLQLTLEIMSNLVTCWIPSNDDGGDDTTMMVSTPVGPTGSPLQTVLCENRFGPAVTDLLDGLVSYYYSSSRDHYLQEQTYDDDDLIRSDVVETIGKASACLSNCILTGTLIGDSEECTRTWDAMFAMFRRAIASTGGGIPPNDITDAVTSCMVVLIRRRPQLLRNDDDMTVLVSSLGPSSPAAGIETQRNVVAMLSTVIAQVAAGAGQGGSMSQASSLTVNESLVRDVTDTLVKLLSSYSQHSPQTPQAVSLYGEILNAFMDWYGQDDFFPRTFEELKLSDVIQRTLKHVPASSLSPEEEEVFYNAGRFLEYKQQL
jgi:hypothetical protein